MRILMPNKSPEPTPVGWFDQAFDGSEFVSELEHAMRQGYCSRLIRKASKCGAIFGLEAFDLP
jgi:hypothetical protein